MHVVLDNVLLQTLARLFELSSQRRDFAPERLFQRTQLPAIILHLRVHLIPPILKLAL